MYTMLLFICVVFVSECDAYNSFYLEYIDYLMTWVQSQLDDETVFPSKVSCILTPIFTVFPRLLFLTLVIQIGIPFPKSFVSVTKTICKRLFRVYAHIYHSHFESVVGLGEEAHLNTSFKHFIYFVQVDSNV